MSNQNVPAVAYAPEHTTIEVAGDMLCSCCFQPADAVVRPLKRCSACLRVSYCSPKCQKSDWILRHKQFCTQFKKVNEHEKHTAKPSNLLELIKQKSIKEQILSTHNSGHPEPCAACSNNIFKKEIVCRVCFQTPYQAATVKSFESCQGCGMARVCSDKCKEALGGVHSPDECAMLRLLRATERVKIDYHLDRKKSSAYEHLMAPTAGPRRRYVPLARYSGLVDFNEDVSREYADTPDISIMYRRLAGTFETSEPMAAEAVGQLSMEAQSIALTIIAGLEASVPDITTRRSLEIHFVGASNREISTRAMLEEVLHQFPALKDLRIHYVGPEADFAEETGHNWACSVCQARGSRRTRALHAVPYHDFLAQNPARRPDLVVALNTGWSEVDTSVWAPTLQAILKLKIPALFTAYSKQEADRERSFQRPDMDFIVDVQPNKWRGVIPIVNIALRDDTDHIAVYSSQYWYIFKGR
ncbi:hypothetical protein CYLTODRAFT_487780 [Cylindrobasidium torrendii FP15055 ss-10]|uniref:MYND-type domain-containing protein n=1 Tax=Cylindrobasidium torrendii FP15055 ss-10 TaxID=1314674 RepID=A0A0D7BJW8_9AGAR|nr:hypothetical protein CYLTODRAFT_487780 [Cylindrobasidium torrendii FP15055 ss-10]